MIGTVRVHWVRRALALAASFVFVVPGGAAPSDSRRGPTPSDCCDVTGTYEIRFTVKIDPSGHHAFIQLQDGRLVIVRLADGRYEVRGNRSAIIPATASLLTGCGFPSVSGRGTVAGFPNVTGQYKDVEITGDEIGGLLELGIGGELPTGRPICYEFFGTRDPNVPDPGEAVVNTAVQFALRVGGVRRVTYSQPTFFCGIGEGDSVLGYGESIYQGDGTGGYFPAGKLPILAGHDPLAAVPLDRTGSDVQDIAMITRDPAGGDAALNVFTQSPARTFDRTQTLTLGVSYGDTRVFIAAGDLTGDGAPEIMTANEMGRVDTFRFDGGAYTLSQTLDLGTFIEALAPEFADFDGDGARDAALTPRDFDDQALFVMTLQGDGAGNLTPGPRTSDLFCLDPILRSAYATLPRDLNGDGLVDFTIGGMGGTCPTPDSRPIVITLVNRPDQPGTFTPLPPFEVPEGSDTFQLTIYTPECARTPAIIANGAVFAGRGNATFTDTGVRYTLDGVPPVAVYTGDFDGNGVIDSLDLTLLENAVAVQIRSLEPLAERPTISNISIAGKTLVVEGSNFPQGSKILVDGVAYKTKADRASPDTTIFSKKALKKIRPGTTVTVQVRTPDGLVSNGLIFQR